MPSGIDVEERFGSRRHSGGDIEFLYKVTGSDETADIRTAILVAAPITHDGVSQVGITDLNQEGNELWFATVLFSNGENTVEGEEPEEATQTFQFDTSGGTQHITQSLPTTEEGGGTAYYPVTEAPIFYGAIGVGSDGDIAGVDIGAAVFDFSVTREIPVSQFDSAYVQKLYTLAWHYNDSTINVTVVGGVTLTFQAGELLFKGASGGGQSGGRISVTFNFSGSPNRTDFTIGDITVSSKLGWEYLWVYYRPAIEESSSATKFRVMKPTAVYVESVYYPADLSELNVD